MDSDSIDDGEIEFHKRKKKKALADKILGKGKPDEEHTLSQLKSESQTELNSSSIPSEIPQTTDNAFAKRDTLMEKTQNELSLSVIARASISNSSPRITKSGSSGTLSNNFRLFHVLCFSF